MVKVFDVNKIWAYLCASFLGFFEPISVLILWLLIFIMADLITGVWAAIKAGNIIQSAKLQRTVYKFLTYTISVCLLHGIDTYMVTWADCGLSKIGATIICGIELYSIFENFYKITNNHVFKILTQFTLKKIQEQTGVSVDEK